MAMLSDLKHKWREPLKLFPGIIAFLLSAVGIVAVSLWWKSYPTHPPLVWIPKVENGEIHFGVVGGIIIGLSICFLLVCFGSKGFHGYRDRIAHAFSNWVFLCFFLGALPFYFLVLAFASSIKPMSGDPRFWHSLLYHIEDNPGGLFVLLTGLPTLYGVALAIEQLWEMRRAIHSFSELMDRLSLIAKTATPENPLRIVAYTPSVGYLAQPEDEWNLFHKTVTDRTTTGKGEPIAQIVCLKKEELPAWHDLFQGRTTLRGKIDSTLSKGATKAGEELVDGLLTARSGDSCNNVCRLPFNCLPGYYLFFTKYRALIVVPLFLPLPLPPEIPDDLKDFNTKLPTVQMIGFETTDRSYIRDFEVMFQRYLELNGRI